VSDARTTKLPHLGTLALAVAGLGLLSGAFLAFHYANTLESARDSVAYLTDEVTGGALLRGMHHWAGTLAIVLAGLHALRVFLRGGHKRPNHRRWIIGAAILFVLVGFAYTGYLLPGDERAYTGLGVMAGIAESTPVVGESAASVLRGGEVVSSAMVARIYAVHIAVLPALLFLLIVALVLECRRSATAAGTNGGANGDGEGDALTWSNAEGAWTLGLTVLLILLAIALPPALGPRADTTGAGSPDAKPEWFLLWVNMLLKLAPGAKFFIGGVLPGALAGAFVMLPFLSRGKERAPAKRRLEIRIVGLTGAALLCLTVWSIASTPAPEEDDEPVATVTDGLSPEEFEEQAHKVIKRFRCTRCHTIDGDPDTGDGTSPPLDRDGRDGVPPFGDIYSRAFFRLKVADPIRFWSDTGMSYTPKSRKPTPDQLDVLERFFFLDYKRD